MKSSKTIYFIALIILFPMLCSCSRQNQISFTAIASGSAASNTGQLQHEIDTAASEGDAMQNDILARCNEISSVYRELYLNSEKTVADDRWRHSAITQAAIDLIETTLLDAGYDVLDSDGVYPSYLATADTFYSFWECVKRQESSQQEIISVSEYGSLTYRLFTYDANAGAAYFYCMTYDVEANSSSYYETYRILDWEVTEKGNFYYRILPADNKHYEDYTLIRLEAPDKELYDMNLRYIMPIGYLATNMFLIDWSESNWNGLSFNDLWEYLYYSAHQQQYLPDSADYLSHNSQYKIPAREFEQIIMPYFNLDIDTFRILAHYQEEGDYYIWRPLETNDFVFLGFYTCISEVTGYRKNADRTITITVDVLSTDLKMDRLFSHEVTVRPLNSGSFQYVSNKVTYQTAYGLPFCKPRITWNVS